MGVINKIFGQGFYRPHTKRGCHRSALANFFLVEGDSETAAKVFWGYPAHEFVGPEDATIQATTPKIVRDLTGHAYEATLYADDRDLEERVRRSAYGKFNGKGEMLVKSVMEDMAAGNVRPLEEYKRNSDNALYVLAHEYHGIAIGQWVTAIPEQDYFIDDGIVRRPLHTLEVFGVLSIRKNGTH